MQSETDSGPLGRFAMVRHLAGGWWLFMLRGVIAILFGVMALLVPGVGLAVILGFLAAYFVLEGASTVVQAIRGGPDPRGRSKVWLWVDGIASLVAGAVVLLVPGLSAVFLVLMVGAWSVVVGVLRLVMAFRTGEVLLGLLGALAVLVGAWMMVNPGPGLLAVIWLVGLEAMLMGGLFVAIGLRLRKIANDPHGPAAGRG